MRGFPVFLAALAVIGLGYWAYSQTILTQAAIRDVERLQREIGAESERLSVLRAEWAYLNRPDRLRELVDFNFERLQLLPMVPDQFGRWRSFPARARAPDPTLQVEDLLFENASHGGGRPMTRTPLRPLARIIEARQNGENPDAIERENLRLRHEAQRDKLRVRAESRLLLVACVSFWPSAPSGPHGRAGHDRGRGTARRRLRHRRS
jgi:hypothetical protein